MAAATAMSEEHIAYIKNNLGRNITETLFERFKDLIVTGQLPGGSVLPSESALAEMLGVGRSTLREAYTALSVLGFIKRTKTGTYVSKATEITNVQPFKLTVDARDLEDLLEFRLMMEGKTASYAAKRATAEDIARIEKSYKIMVNSRDNMDLFMQEDVKFHFAISDSTHNKFLIGTMTAVQEAFETSIYSVINMSLTVNPKLIDVTIDFHDQILKAIKDRDWRRADSAMREHIAYANLIVKV